MTLLKGKMSFAQGADLTLQTLIEIKLVRPSEQGFVLRFRDGWMCPGFDERWSRAAPQISLQGLCRTRGGDKDEEMVVLIVATACSRSALARRRASLLEELMSAPFPDNLTAPRHPTASHGHSTRKGKRQHWVAEGPSFSARRLTAYWKNDGQPISELSFSPTRTLLFYVRGEGKRMPADNSLIPPAILPERSNRLEYAWSGGEPKKWTLATRRKFRASLIRLCTRWADLDGSFG